MPDNISDNVSTNTTATSTRPTQGVSKLALLASFVAGAFAAWIIIESNDPDQQPAAPAMSIQR